MSTSTTEQFDSSENTETENSGPTFEDIYESDPYSYGSNNHVFISHNRAIPESGTPNDFVQIRKMFKRTQGDGMGMDSHVSIPYDKDAIDWAIQELEKIRDEIDG